MYNSEYKFMLVRCKDDILLYLHDTGLSSYINIMGDFKDIGYGIIYEYLKDKISYSKLIEKDKNDENKLKEHVAHMAQIIKKVHQTQCDTKVF